jgi:hypothetical protein
MRQMLCRNICYQIQTCAARGARREKVSTTPRLKREISHMWCSIFSMNCFYMLFCIVICKQCVICYSEDQKSIIYCCFSYVDTRQGSQNYSRRACASPEKQPISFVTSVCPSVNMYQQASHWTCFVTFDTGSFYANLCRNVKCCSNLKMSGTLHKDLSIFTLLTAVGNVV